MMEKDMSTDVAHHDREDREHLDNAARAGHGPWCPALASPGPEPATASSTTNTLPARKHTSAQMATVLIVDDDLATVDIFAQVLRLEGYEVRTALSAETGIRVVQASRLDAILVDFNMPLANGVEFLRRLRPDEGHRV
jgi:PleD family two-component response regulator